MIPNLRALSGHINLDAVMGLFLFINIILQDLRIGILNIMIRRSGILKKVVIQEILHTLLIGIKNKVY